MNSKDFPKMSPFWRKDYKKALGASKFIGAGAPGSSTDAYRKAFGSAANTAAYHSTDIVFVSVNGDRPGRVLFNRAELGLACSAGATIRTDIPYDRSRKYNVGEREVAAYLESSGYVETKPGEWNPVVK